MTEREVESRESIAEIQRRFSALIDRAVPKGDPIGFAEPPYFALIRDAIALARTEYAKADQARAESRAEALAEVVARLEGLHE